MDIKVKIKNQLKEDLKNKEKEALKNIKPEKKVTQKTKEELLNEYWKEFLKLRPTVKETLEAVGDLPDGKIAGNILVSNNMYDEAQQWKEYRRQRFEEMSITNEAFDSNSKNLLAMGAIGLGALGLGAYLNSRNEKQYQESPIKICDHNDINITLIKTYANDIISDFKVFFVSIDSKYDKFKNICVLQSYDDERASEICDGYNVLYLIDGDLKDIPNYSLDYYAWPTDVDEYNGFIDEVKKFKHQCGIIKFDGDRSEFFFYIELNIALLKEYIRNNGGTLLNESNIFSEAFDSETKFNLGLVGLVGSGILGYEAFRRYKKYKDAHQYDNSTKAIVKLCEYNDINENLIKAFINDIRTGFKIFFESIDDRYNRFKNICNISIANDDNIFNICEGNSTTISLLDGNLKDLPEYSSNSYDIFESTDYDEYNRFVGEVLKFSHNYGTIDYDADKTEFNFDFEINIELLKEYIRSNGGSLLSEAMLGMVANAASGGKTKQLLSSTSNITQAVTNAADKTGSSMVTRKSIQVAKPYVNKAIDATGNFMKKHFTKAAAAKGAQKAGSSILGKVTSGVGLVGKKLAGLSNPITLGYEIGKPLGDTLKAGADDMDAQELRYSIQKGNNTKQSNNMLEKNPNIARVAARNPLARKIISLYNETGKIPSKYDTSQVPTDPKEREIWQVAKMLKAYTGSVPDDPTTIQDKFFMARGKAGTKAANLVAPMQPAWDKHIRRKK